MPVDVDDGAPVGSRKGHGEQVLWGSRLLMLVGVTGSILMALVVLWMSVVDLSVLLADTVSYTSAADRSGQRADIIGAVVKIVDGFLLAAIMILVAFGLYELFISRLDPARDGSSGPRVLLVSSIDDLKDRIAKLVVLILVIEFFQRSLRATLAEADDLLRLAAATSLVGKSPGGEGSPGSGR